MNNDKKVSLTKYVEQLKQRINSPVPAKHAHRPQVYMDMLRLDLKKTLAKMEKLS
jgi:hypothetical protein